MAKMTKRQRIDAARERRLWLGQVIIPGISLGIIAYNQSPKFRNCVVKSGEKIRNFTNNIISKWKRS